MCRCSSYLTYFSVTQNLRKEIRDAILREIGEEEARDEKGRQPPSVNSVPDNNRLHTHHEKDFLADKPKASKFPNVEFSSKLFIKIPEGIKGKPPGIILPPRGENTFSDSNSLKLPLPSKKEHRIQGQPKASDLPVSRPKVSFNSSRQIDVKFDARLASKTNHISKPLIVPVKQKLRVDGRSSDSSWSEFDDVEVIDGNSCEAKLNSGGQPKANGLGHENPSSSSHGDGLAAMVAEDLKDPSSPVRCALRQKEAGARLQPRTPFDDPSPSEKHDHLEEAFGSKTKIIDKETSKDIISRD